MKIRFVILGFFLMFQPGTGQGQYPVFRSYTMSDGLTNNAIRKIYQDSRGFLWICTWDGLNKFEGHQFSRYTSGNNLPHSMVNDVIEAAPGEIMVALNDGSISRIRNDRPDQQAQQTGYIVNQFLPDAEKGMLGVADKYGIVKIGDTEVSPLGKSTDFSLYEIIAWHQYYITIGDRVPVRIYDRNLKLVAGYAAKNTFPRCIYKLREDKILIGTENGLRMLNMQDPLHPVLQSPPPPLDHPAILNNPVHAIFQDQTGYCWFGTYNGLVRISPSGIARVFTVKDGLPGNRVTCITEDKEKNIWIGTYSGLAKLPYQSLTLPASDNGSLFKGSLLGLAPLNGQQLAVIATDAVYSYDIDRDLFKRILGADSGYLATPVAGSKPFSFIYKDKVYSWNERSGQLEPVSGFEPLYYFSASMHRSMICAAHAGVSIHFKSGKTIRVLDSVRMHIVCWDQQGRILAGAWSEGLYRISVDTLTETVTAVEDFSGIADLNHIRALMVDQHHNIWAGTRYNGVIVLADTGGGKFTTKQLTQQTGLTSDWIHFLTEAPDGNIWIGSLAGLSKVIVSGPSFRVFNFSKAIDFYSPMTGLVYAGGNHFWGTTNNGLFHFRDMQLEKTGPLPVYFTDIRLGNADTRYVPQEPGKMIRLPFTQNYLRFEFASPTYLNEKDVYYSYHLLGSRDTSWTEPSSRHAVEYASLSPGKYVFEVKMKGWNGAFGPVTSFPFTIHPPFWQTGWFLLAVTIVLVLSVYSLIRYRTRQLLKLQQVRQAIATDLHDEIGSSLTNISILAQLSLESLAEQDKTKKFILRIRDEVLSSNQALDDIIWSVNARNDSLDETLARMRRYVGEFLDNSSTQYQLNIISSEPEQKINMEQRKDLFLIFKEALNNIHKHAAAGHTDIRITVDHHQVHILISDDGKGYDSNAETHRNGLKNMRYRVERWKGIIGIQTSPGAGTRIDIKMPLAGN